MKRRILAGGIMALCLSCSNTKGTINGWVGKSKQNLIKSMGAPVRIVNSGKGGEILIYADQIYSNSHNGSGSRMVGVNHWQHIYVYVDTIGKIYSCRNEVQKFPPQQVVLGK